MGENGSEQTLNLTLHVWRQKNRNAEGRFVTYEARDISPDMSFLEMLDVVNEGLIEQGRGADRVRPRLPRGDLRPCGVVINGDPHGPRRATTACQLHMRSFQRRRRPDARAVAGGGLPGHQGPDRGPRRASTGSSPPAASSRVRTGNAPEANCHPRAEGRRRARHGRRRVHRLRRLRRRLPERLGHALRRGQGRAPQPRCPQGQPERNRRVARDGRADGRRGVRRAARTTASARPPARRRSASNSSPA